MKTPLGILALVIAGALSLAVLPASAQTPPIMTASAYADHADQTADAYDDLADNAIDPADAADWRDKANDLRRSAAKARAAAARDELRRQLVLLRQASANAVGAAGPPFRIEGHLQRSHRPAVTSIRQRIETPSLGFKIEAQYHR